jgi:hypothetical protein
MARSISEITVYDMATFTAKLAAFNKRCDKLGFDAATVEGVIEYKERDELWGDVVFVSYQVTLSYDRPQLPGGWQLVASLDHRENLVRCVPGETLPVGYDAHDQKCDHCGVNRYRTETFILRNDAGQTKQIGRNCLGDFLGIDAARLLGQIDLVGSMGEDEEGWSGRREPSGFDLTGYLVHVAAMIRSEGWSSRTAAQNGSGKRSSADAALDNIDNRMNQRKDRHGHALWVDPISSDRELAERAVAWMGTLKSRENLGDYLTNLAQISENGFATRHSAGFAASAINAMLKEESEELERRTSTKRHLGAVGQKLEGDFTLVNSRGFDGSYGISFLHIFKDADGNTVKWSTATELEPGRTYHLTAKIKDLEEYRGVPQTVITRAKIA